VITAWLLAGSLVGMMNGLARWWTVSHLRYQTRRSALALVWGGFILRQAAVAALLTLGLKRGIIPGLLAFAGMCLARWGSVIWFGALRWQVRPPLMASSSD
jgi:hypothetical protein